MASSSLSLSELLQAAQHMNTKADLNINKQAVKDVAVTSSGTTVEDLPKVDRSLAQLVQVGESLWPQHAGRDTAKIGPDQEAHASILLGSRGLDLPHMTNRLATLSSLPHQEAATAPACATLPVEGASTMAAFLRQHRQNAIVSALHDANQQTSAEVEKVYWQQQSCTWEQNKQNLLAAFTHSGNELLNITVPTPNQDSITNTSLFRPGSSVSSVSGGLTSDEMLLTKALLEYNKQVLCHGVKPELSKSVHSLVRNMNNQGTSDLWRVVARMSTVAGALASGEGLTGAHRTRPALASAVVHAATSLLQEKYTEHMQAMVCSDLGRAERGGVPGVISLVKGYLGVVLHPSQATDLEDGEGTCGAPVWPLLFYCIRAGALKEAASAALNNSSPSVVEISSALKQCLHTDERKVPSETEKRLRLSYKRAMKSIRDPYKRAVYCILSRCHVNEDHQDIITTTDDYLWLKLMLVDTSVSPDNPPSTPTPFTSSTKQDVLTLHQLQVTLYKTYGESHFQAYEQPLLYTTVLLLTGQFEAAVEFLRRSDKFLPHAVHIAICLFVSRLLCVPNSLGAPLLSRETDEGETCLRLNMARLLLHYTKRFESSHPHEALHYCYLLRNMRSPTGEDVFLNCISELTLNSREFDLVLGRLSEDGSRTPGIVDTFNVDIQEVTNLVAQHSEKKGLHEDAVKLYDLAKNHEKVLSLLNKLLSQVVHLTSSANTSAMETTFNQTNVSGGERDRIIDLACTIGARYRQHGHNASQTTSSTMHLLLDLGTMFDLYHNGRHQEVVDVLQRLHLIALRREEVDNRVASMSTMAHEVKEVLPSVLLAALTATHHIYSASAESTASTKNLQQQARAIVTFAGMIPLRLHADVNARLVQLEALIN